MGAVPNRIIDECKQTLVQMKSDILNQLRSSHAELLEQDSGGDEADQSARQLAEHASLAQRERLRSRLLEIEFALARIEQGTFGICEETEEPIEVERLRALPYTRLSIEGAEIREAMSRRLAR
jgi:DnaK suppressor protein